MTKSELFYTLSDIDFAEKDPRVIESEVIGIYESMAGRTLSRADPVRIFLEAVVLVIIQQRNKIDFAAKQNLLAYATGDYLDHKGAMLGVARLSASHAVCTVRFTLSEIQNQTILIPEGLKITPDGNVIFATVEAVEIPAGEIYADVTAQCVSAGIIGNGFVAGQIKKLVDIFPYEMSVENISESNGGSEIESDENLRERIQIAPESFSVAGPSGAYEYFARSAHSDIIDVAVIGANKAENAGTVRIYPLMNGGVLPSDEIINAVYEKCSADDVAPDTDFLMVMKPEVVSYDIDVAYVIDKDNASVAAGIQSAVNSAVNEWIQWQRNKLGRDINPSELIARMVNAGAKRVVVTSPNYRKLDVQNLAVINAKNIHYGGLE